MTLSVAGLRYKMCENHDAKRGMTTVGGPFSVTVGFQTVCPDFLVKKRKHQANPSIASWPEAVFHCSNYRLLLRNTIITS